MIKGKHLDGRIVSLVALENAVRMVKKYTLFDNMAVRSLRVVV